MQIKSDNTWVSQHPESIPISYKGCSEEQNQGLHAAAQCPLCQGKYLRDGREQGGGGAKKGTKSPDRVDFPDGLSLHHSQLDPLFSVWEARDD